MASTLDELDFALISLLQEDGRRATSAIARAVEIPESTVRRRIERLLNEGVIQVVAVVQHPETLGLPVHANLFFRVAPSDLEEVIAALQGCDEIRWMALTTGPLNVQVEGFFHSTDHLREFSQSRMAAIPGIQEMRVDIILDLFKNRFDWSAMFRTDGNGVGQLGNEVWGNNGESRTGP